MNSKNTNRIQELKDILQKGELKTAQNLLEEYSADKWKYSHLPDAVAFPRSTKSVSRILAFADKHRIPVTPRGGGCGYAGSAVPAKGGIVLSTERLNRIKEIHAGDFVAVVQPAVITQHLQEEAKKKGLFYPPDPASRDECFIGGNIATNAGGPRCLKYGVTRDYVLGLEVVLADGTILRLGSRTHKNKTGFDLGRLFVGSEGMLGVITEATLKLIPHPPFRAALSVGFGSMRMAAKAIRSVFAAGHLPCALEVADSFTLEAARKRTGNSLLKGCLAHLIIELDGQEKTTRAELRQVERVVRELEPRFVRRAFGNVQCEQIWQFRREFSYALRDTGLQKMNEDITVPRSRLEDLFKFTEALQKRFGIPIACFGHAGDGNIHANVMVDESESNSEQQSRKVLDALFSKVVSWGGVITGEHGVGLSRKPWWKLAVPPEVDEFHRRIKHSLDPNRILNPGKFLD
ncbi:MAG: FAD-binding oxidoreductase [Verrucomicrobia bacterium]|nr:FAD-binding oxidoreductase [Verrucomicrobiota bacterium]MCF7709133.1 FAD-binding oxidoreductase [Verrucomicrobiota bacterium]